MTRSLILPLAVAAALLAGCMPVPAHMQAAPPAPLAPIPEPMPLPVAPPPTLASSGLQERQPDVCGKGQYQSQIGQHGSIIPSLGITKPYRVVEYRGIEPQDYSAGRIVFRLDASGTILNIDCG